MGKKIIIHSIYALLFLLPLGAGAHPVAYKAISTELSVHNDSINFLTRVQHLFEYETSTPTETKKLLSDYFKKHLILSPSGETCAPVVTEYESDQLGAVSTFKGSYTCAHAIDPYKEFSITSTLFEEFFEQFDHYITVQTGSRTINITLNRADPKFNGVLFERQSDLESQKASAFEIDRAQQPKESFFKLVGRFIVLGIEHIIFGFDHVLFLIAIILVLSSLKDIVLLVTSFTISHSLTLILAGLGLITLSSRITEPIIALSIAYLAAQNIWNLRTGAQEHFRQRFITSFSFGLIHGLGFAGALKEIVIPENYFLPALLTFNIGVEIGQIGLLILFVPMLKYIEIKKFLWRKTFLISMSLAITLIASWWFIERIFYAS